MVKINENLKCPECGSVWQELSITNDYHKVLIRKCHNNCSRDKEILEDYGYSEKIKIKMLRKQERQNN